MNIELEIQGLINKTNKDLLNENANKDSRVFPTQRDLMAGIVSKHIANQVIPFSVMEAHKEGVIHFHDMDYSPALPFTNCCLVDLKGMLQNGFKLGNAQIETPKSIGVATAIMAQITAQVASHQYGGTTFANVDLVLAPYVEKTFAKHVRDARKYQVALVKDYAISKTEKDVFDAFQAYEYEVNTLFSSNGQTPFVTITFGMGTSWEETLLTRIKSLEGVTASVAPILYQEGAFGVRMKPDDEILELFKNGRSSISLGYIGIHEFDMLTFKGSGKLVLKYINTKLNKWTEETGYAFSLYSTPAESLCYRFCKIDQAKFGDVKGVTDKGWYTNSFHVSVEENLSPFEKIDREAPYHSIAKGGHISYVELPDMKRNLEGLEAVWDYAIEKLDYFGVNMPVDKCLSCGSTHEMTPTENGFTCSICGYLCQPLKTGVVLTTKDSG
ncbi:hypothetical protein vBKpnAMK6_00254 [Klebsiella phage vB_Kpn_AM_K6]